MELVEGDARRASTALRRSDPTVTTRCRSRDRSPRRWKPRTSRRSSPRSEARQYQVTAGRHRQSPRLRSGESARKPAEAGGPGGTLRSLRPEPTITSPAMTMQGVILGTAPTWRRSRRRVSRSTTRGHLGVRLRALRNADRRAALFAGDDVNRRHGRPFVRADPDWTALPATTAEWIRTPAGI